jgi:hypothetical protein
MGSFQTGYNFFSQFFRGLRAAVFQKASPK